VAHREITRVRSLIVVIPSIGLIRVSNITASTTPGLPTGRLFLVGLKVPNRQAHHRGPQDVGVVEDVGVRNCLFGHARSKRRDRKTLMFASLWSTLLWLR
jgi:hypothetical protein